MPEPPPQAARNRADRADKDVPQNLNVDVKTAGPPSGVPWMTVGLGWLVEYGAKQKESPRTKLALMNSKVTETRWLLANDGAFAMRRSGGFFKTLTMGR